jgi:hypothetical protein
MFLATNKGKCVICIGDKNIIPGGVPVKLTKLESDHPEIQSHFELGDLELAEVGDTEGVSDGDVTLDDMTLAQLNECAAGNKIDLGQATKKEDIIAIIKAAEPGK